MVIKKVFLNVVGKALCEHNEPSRAEGLQRGIQPPHQMISVIATWQFVQLPKRVGTHVRFSYWQLGHIYLHALRQQIEQRQYIEISIFGIYVV